MRTLFPLFAAMAFGLAVSGSKAISDHSGVGIRPHWENTAAMQHYREQLYAAHRECNATAQVMVISPDLGQLCANVYLRLKLSFLKGVTIDRFPGINVKSRAIGHEKGYAAFRAWEYAQKLPRD